jgi:hypothetical protein
MTKRLAVVNFVTSGSGVCVTDVGFGVCGVKPLRRLDGGLGLGFRVDGGGPARKRCGDGACVGIVMFSLGLVRESIGRCDDFVQAVSHKMP